MRRDVLIVTIPISYVYYVCFFTSIKVTDHTKTETIAWTPTVTITSLESEQTRTPTNECTNPSGFFCTTFTSFHFIFSLILFLSHQSKKACTTIKPLSFRIFSSSIGKVTMADRVPPRGIEQNWTIDQQGAALLNRLPNSTSVSGNLLEVANTHLENTTFISNEAEAHHQTLCEIVT